jgi:putative membrane protein
MKLRALAVIAAFAMPALASATPADVPPTNTPTNNSPTNNTPSNHPADPTPMPDQAPATPGKLPSDSSPTRSPSDKATAGDTNKSEKLSDADTKIVAHLHHVNQMEISMGQLAQKSGSAHVKDYASTLLTDHQSSDKDLTSFAKAHKVTAIPADKPATDADRQDDKDAMTQMAHMKTLKGAEFDKAFLNMMIADHDKELTRIDVSISSATNPDLKSLLQTVKPVLQRHADQARDLQKSPQASAGPGKG